MFLDGIDISSWEIAGTGDNNTTRIIIIIAVSASVGVILIIIVGYVLRKRVKKKAYEASESKHLIHKMHSSFLTCKQ